MKSYFLLLGFISLSLLSGFSQTQDVTNEENYSQHDIIVRLNFKLLNWSVIDNKDLLHTSIENLLNENGKEAVQGLSVQSFDFEKLKASKIFPFLSTADSISIGRQGNKVYIPPFWATFNVEKPKELSYDTFLSAMQNLYPVVIYAHPNYNVTPTNFPNDSLFNQQLSIYNNDLSYSHITHINLDSAAWNIEQGKNWVKVGVFDTGIDSSHTDLKLLTGWNSSDQEDPVPSWGIDQYGHGTNVASIIGSIRNNSTGTAGIAGGDGSDTTGVSLIDFKYDDGDNIGAVGSINKLSATIVDAARSPGTYYDWATGTDWENPFLDFHYANSPGYGIHIGNHSYSFRIGNYKTEDIDNETGGNPGSWKGDCDLCQESFLFSLQNGVISVVSRGNKNFDTHNEWTYIGTDNLLPACYDDSWVLSVGASGNNGERLVGIGNPTYSNASDSYYSIRGRDVDIIAPGTVDMVYTAASLYDSTSNNGYSTFNGTSAAAPHASGVAALLVSYYNKPCYSNINLDPADVEYILQKSTTKTDSNIVAGGYAEDAGWGLLNAYEALKMIDFPTYQIVHPIDTFVNQFRHPADTISLYYPYPLSTVYSGPIGSTFPIQKERIYQVERVRIDLTYNFGQYILPTTELLDVWVRESQTNSLGFVKDSIIAYNPQFSANELILDTFKIEPRAQLTIVSDSVIKLTGYYYHFISKYAAQSPDLFLADQTIEQSENSWYPINPDSILPKMMFSIYLKDSTVSRYDFACDSDNELLDSVGYYAHLQEEIVQDFILYPNPGSNQIIIDNLPSNGKLMLIDLSGRLIDETDIKHKATHTFDVSALRKGVYFVSFTNDIGVLTKKWIKR